LFEGHDFNDMISVEGGMAGVPHSNHKANKDTKDTGFMH
jgi:hypothetical protein